MNALEIITGSGAHGVTRPTFSPDVMVCAEVASRAYHESTIRSVLASALIVEMESVNVIGFEGTHDIRDFLTDFECRRTVDDAHGGFSRSTDSILREVRDAILSLPPKPLLLVGHSKGGAEATRMADVLWDVIKDRLAGVITFGEPRGGGKFYAARCEERFGALHIRYVNEQDIVPRVPPWICGNRHSGRERFFLSYGGITENPPLGKKLFSDVYGAWLDWQARLAGFVADHGIEHYIEALGKTSRPMIGSTKPQASYENEKRNRRI